MLCCSDQRHRAPPSSLKSIRGLRQGPLTTGVVMGTRADNWAGDSVATKQRGLGNEINDVVLGLVALAGGLSAPAP